MVKLIEVQQSSVGLVEECCRVWLAKLREMV
jgi:hypothetical protein